LLGLFDEFGNSPDLKKCIEEQLALLTANAPNEFVHTNGKGERKKPIRVYVDGCFDIMHSGHYNALRQAKQLGDILVVGVHSDEEILRNKGPTTMKDEERIAMVKNCKWVDEVVFGVPYSPTITLLDSLNCDFVVHGDDMPTNAEGKSAYSELIEAGRCKIIKRTEGVSTTTLVGRLLLMTREHHMPHSDSQKLDPTKDLSLSASNFLPTSQRIYQFSKFADRHYVYNNRPQNPQKIVYLAGSFDLFHCGHLEILEEAKKLGDFLLVGIHDDRTINKLMGKNYPIMNLHERVLNVLSCKWVDEVILGAPEEVTSEMISTMGIKVVAHHKVDYGDEKHEGPDSYQAAKDQKLYTELNIKTKITLEAIADRILENRKIFEEVYARKKKKQDVYLKESGEYRTNMREL
jgi:ethanolamine-phosphate cytidylyltransferase